jgi:hypothetical protein
MSPRPARLRTHLAALAVLGLGLLGCAVGAILDAPGFFRAWLCGFLFWLGVPLAGVALVLVHDLSGGAWMTTARPALGAAVATMPLATLAGIPAFVGLGALYGWVHAPPGLANTWYLNSGGFVARYAAYVVLWNLLAAFALWAPRGRATPIAPALSWLSGVGLVLLAFSTSFAAIDWMLSVEPSFWSSIFPMIAGAGWFVTGLALVLLVIALALPEIVDARNHMADLAAILFAAVAVDAYLEFMQFVIVWEGNLAREIPWYLPRLSGGWRAVLWLSGGLGCGVPALVLLWAPSRRRRAAVAAACLLVLLGRAADKTWLVLPAYAPPPWWLVAVAMLALGGGMVLLFNAALRRHDALLAMRPFAWGSRHG